MGPLDSGCGLKVLPQGWANGEQRRLVVFVFVIFIDVAVLVVLVVVELAVVVLVTVLFAVLFCR